MYKPLLMMRTRGLMGSIPFKAAKLTTSLVKSAGAFIGASGGGGPQPLTWSVIPTPLETHLGDPYPMDLGDYVTGGVLPYEFYRNDGTLPTGISLNQDGTFSGLVEVGRETQDINYIVYGGDDVSAISSYQVWYILPEAIPCADVIYGSHLDEFPIIEIGDIPTTTTLAGSAVISNTNPKFGAQGVSTIDDTGAIGVQTEYFDNGLEVTYSFWIYIDTSIDVGGFPNREFWYTDGNRTRSNMNYQNRFFIWIDGDDREIFTGLPVLDEWNHFEIAQGVDYTEFFVNGTSVLNYPVKISDPGGRSVLNTVGKECGFVDEILIVKGITHTEDFTPPPAPFETTCEAPPIVHNVDLTVGNFFSSIYGFALTEAFGVVSPTDLDGTIIDEISGTNAGAAVFKFGDGSEQLNAASSLEIGFGSGLTETLPWNSSSHKYLTNPSPAFTQYLIDNDGNTVSLEITEIP